VQLTDWPPGAVSRDHAVHVAYIRAARRARRGVKVEYVSPGEVAKRDRWACAVCGQAVRKHWTADQLAEAPAFTFCVPFAEGGDYTKRNARFAHYGCVTPGDPHLRRGLERALAGDLAAKARAGRRDTLCTKGHRLAGDNLLKSSDGRRRCKQCRRDRERAQRAAIPA
jgi:hypothetical protein